MLGYAVCCMLEATCKKVAACHSALVSRNIVLQQAKDVLPKQCCSLCYGNMPLCIPLLASACILLELTISSEAQLKQNGRLLLALAQGACSVNAPAARDLFQCR